MFTSQDLEQLKSKGISLDKAESQITSFVDGFPFLPIARAATLGDGIFTLTSDAAALNAHMWDKATQNSELRVVKFIPASGAATRMFKEYFEFVAGGEPSQAVGRSIANIENFAFYNDLKALGVDLNDPKAVISSMLNASGLGYGAAPKALIKFHKYSNLSRTALEEHLVEGALYGSTAAGAVKLHFTVSPEHLDAFKAVVEANGEFFEKRFATTYDITYSVQRPSTDTLAVDLDNLPFRTDSGELLFRPAGHGALIENLADLVGDVIFIKTVDNVQPDHRKADTILHKKALAAYGVELQGKIFGMIGDLLSDRANVNQAVQFVERHLGYKFSVVPSVDQVVKVLDRPLRVCGMVRNEGEPGGGPFWVSEDNGDLSVQIAESSQIAPEQSSLMKSSTHFNPVDLVCFTKNHKGGRFDLRAYTDPRTGFISEKSFQGRALKAQELPGLWNGAMARWNTVFVEVPISTFAPVKVLGDLLRPEHQ